MPTYFLMINISGAITGFSKHMALSNMFGKDGSSRKDAYMTRSAVLRILSAFSSNATCFTIPSG